MHKLWHQSIALCHMYPRAPCNLFFWSGQILELNVCVLHWKVVILKTDARMVGFWGFVFFFLLKGQTFLYLVNLAEDSFILKLTNSFFPPFILTDLRVLQKTGCLEICSCILSPVFWYKGKQSWLCNFQIQSDAGHASSVELPQPLYNANSLVYESWWFLREDLYIELLR